MNTIATTTYQRLGGTFGRFLVVGGTGFLIQAAILRLLVGAVRVDPTVANLAAASVAIFSNFNLNNVWTFASERISGISPYLRKMAGFYATSAIGVILIQTGVIFLGDLVLGPRLYFEYFVLGTALLLAYNFSIYRLVIWRTPTRTEVLKRSGRPTEAAA